MADKILKRGSRDSEVIGLYHSAQPVGPGTVLEQTAQDLDFNALFAFVDRTVGTPGAQLLYDQLRRQVDDDDILRERRRQQEVFRGDPSLRRDCHSILARLNHPDGSWLVSTLVSPLPPNPRFAPWLYLLSGGTLACLAGFWWVHGLLPLAILLMLVNVIVNAQYGQRILPYFTGFAQITNLLLVAERLAALTTSVKLPQLAALRESRARNAQIKRTLGWLVADRSSLPEVAASLYAYLNMLFLFDIIVYLRSNDKVRRFQAELLKVFEMVGSLDASASVAAYLEERREWCRPEFNDNRTVAVTRLFHPLLTGPVPNDFALEGKSALIAGPNMAGKTAFIRTVGLNFILARTLGFCFAETANFPRAILASAIRREDSLSAGESYFFAEIQQLLEFTRASQRGPTYIFLIDEIFRGTNTVERIAAAAAVLSYLAKEHVVLTTTHDIELQDILMEHFSMFHFSDQVIEGKYSFDYKIHPGPAQSRNAIKLLELSGYPEEIVRAAEERAGLRNVKQVNS